MIPKKIKIAIAHDKLGGYEVYGSAYENEEEIDEMVREQSNYRNDWDGVSILTLELTRDEPKPEKSWWRKLCGL
jgi:hypothetical protein